MVIRQALYGDKAGSYALLKTDLDNTELAKRLCNVTDLLDRPSTGQISTPLFRSFSVDDNYIFVKSFPDTDPAVRKGRVLSHAMIVEKNSLDKLNDLSDVFSNFITKSDKTFELKDISVTSKKCYKSEFIEDECREFAAINSLLSISEYENTLIWIGAVGYIDFISKIWCGVNPHIRSKFRFGTAFHPQKYDDSSINILSVSEEYKALWDKGNLSIIQSHDTGAPASLPALMLAGERSISGEFIDFIDSFGIIPNEICEYRILEIAFNTYKNRKSEVDLNQLIVLCDLISRFSPDPFYSIENKQDLLAALSSRLKNASVEQIYKLKNVLWHGFSNGSSFVGKCVATWVESSCPSKENTDTYTEAIKSAIADNGISKWWKKSFVDGLSLLFKNKWEEFFAKFVWGVIERDNNLLGVVDDILPYSEETEADMVKFLPQLENDLGESIVSFALERSWYTLHGVSSLSVYPPIVCLKRQLEILPTIENHASLTEMAKIISDDEFVDIAVDFGEIRLVSLAVKKVVANPALLRRIQVSNEAWRQIWFSSIQLGVDLWDEIDDPIDVLYSLLNDLIVGSKVDSGLLLEISNSKYSDLSHFKERPRVWHHLIPEAREGFLKSTTTTLLQQVDEDNSLVCSLEPEVREYIIRSNILSKMISKNAISLSSTIALFEKIDGLLERDLSLFLKAHFFSIDQSARIGKIVSNKRWRDTAKEILHLSKDRSDLSSALKECRSLVGFFDIFFTPFFSESPVNVSEMWWEELLRQCIEKYPKGPGDQSLWIRSGGQEYDLLAHGSGKEFWTDIIYKIKKGREIVSLDRLLKEMLADYPNSSELNKIAQTRATYGK